MGSLSSHVKKAGKAGVVTATGNYSVYFLTIVAQLWLTRMLLPAEFGTYAIVTIAVEVAYAVLMIEFSTVALYRMEDENVFHTAVVMASLWVLLLALICLVLGNALDAWFQRELIVVGTVLLISKAIFGIGAIYAAYLEKDYGFGLMTVLRGFSKAVGIGIGLVAANLNYGVFSLLAIDAIYYALSSVLAIGCSRLQLNVRAFKWDLARFIIKNGSSQVLFRISGILLYRGPLLAIEILTSNRALVGLAERAFYIAGLANAVASSFHTKVAFILFKNLSANEPEYRQFLAFLLWLTSRLLLPLVFVLAGFSTEIINVAFGPKWRPSAKFLEDLALYSACAIIFTILTQVLLVQWRIIIVSLTQGVLALVTVAVAILCKQLSEDLVWIASAVSFSFLLGCVFFFVLTHKGISSACHLGFGTLVPLILAAVVGKASAGIGAYGMAIVGLGVLLVVCLVDFLQYRYFLRSALQALRRLAEARHGRTDG